MKDKRGRGRGRGGPRSSDQDDLKVLQSDPRFAHVTSDPKFQHIPKQERKVKLDSRFHSILTLKPLPPPPSLTETEEDSATRDQEERLQVAPEISERLQDPTMDYARGGGCLFSSDSSDDDSSTDDEDGDEVEEFEWAELDQDAMWDNKVDVEETSRLAVCNLDWDRINAADLMVLFSSFCPLGGSVKTVTIFPSEYGQQRMAEEDLSGPQELTASSHGKKREEEEEEEGREVTVDLDKLEKGLFLFWFLALRRYQRNRLRYFYAVLECDTLETARILYRECDRQPFEGAGILIDLRYIPSDMTFNETPHDLCQTIPRSYQAKNFVTTALQNTRPSLTWDETDPERCKALGTAMAEALKGGHLEEDRLKNFLASSSEEEEEEGDDERDDDDDDSDEDGNEEVKAARIAKFRALIHEIDEKERRKKDREIDMEETLEISGDEEEEEEETTDKKQNKEPELNPFEKYLAKRQAIKKEKRKKKKKKEKGEDRESDELFSDDDVPEGLENLRSDPFFAEGLKTAKGKGKKKVSQDGEEKEEGGISKGHLELLLMDEDQEDKKHFNMREIIKNSEGETKKRRRKNKLKKKMLEKQTQKNAKVDEFKVNASDPRFSQLMTSGEYNIDPSHPQFKRTQAMGHLIGDIQRKRVMESGEEVPSAKKPCMGEDMKRMEMSSLVRRVKRKTGKIKGDRGTNTP
ncbi:ESF1 [Chionoecetes opilio]|uniref:ESF1 n=1 Tax=Chionoecetes opilio TaxID=41210 RepID=A0A8J5CN83_CHIOP|nr:ESF1 [Chionoecetes opilio]